MLHQCHLFHLLQYHQYHPLVIPPVPPPMPPAQSIATHPIQPTHVPQLNWSHFKPESTGNPDEDAEAHLRMNDWIDTHAFQEGVKVQCFCLTLVGEARLWCESLRAINIDWIGLQNPFRQQYSKKGITREHLFHVWNHFILMKTQKH